jgi:DNA-binding transcriptional ArsR family regulator
MANSAELDRTFAACSHPIRRGILERLTAGELSVGEATRDFGVSKPAISRHLKVLEEAGAIVRVVDGRTHRLQIRERSLDDAYAWMARQRELWERKLDVVESFLREQREAAPREPRRTSSREPAEAGSREQRQSRSRREPT